MAQIIDELAEISHRYDAVFCDLWGVVHNGQEIFPDAAEALLKYRLAGGVVVLVTNSPRTPNDVKKQLTELGLPDRAYDAVVSGGGVMQKTVFSIGMRSYFFIGREEDRTLFSDLPTGITNTMFEADIHNADCLIVAGPDYETRPHARDYEIELRQAYSRKIPMYNANPDRVVDHGTSRIECGGALADIYLELGGTVFEFGKPFAGIYDEAIETASQAVGRKINRNNVLVVGDSITTDIKGAMLEDFDALMVTDGLHRQDIHLNAQGQLEQSILDRFLANAEFQPLMAIGRLR